MTTTANTEPRPMTGPEFAAAHGNDSTNWMPADFETEINLAEIDAHRAAHGLAA